MVITLVVWAGFSISLRYISHSTLAPLDVALLRFLVPAVFLLAFIPSRAAALRRIRVGHLLMIACGAGLPFFIIAAIGGRLTSASHVSALIAGTSPLSVALLTFLVWRERIPTKRLTGLAAIVAGVVALVFGLGGIDTTVLAGSLLLLAGSVLWAVFTIGVRRSQIDPISCLIVITFPALAIAGLLVAVGPFESHLGQADPHQILMFGAVQGLAVGILSPFGYAIAIRRLGPFRCASVGALAPGLATLLAVPLLNETPSTLSVLGVVAVTIGVFLSNRST
jgi:drug/metabolite transporter (DMT)-like permease